MSTQIEIQCNGFNIATDNILKKVKQEWRDNGNKLTEIKDINIYFNPLIKTAYYILTLKENNKEVKGELSFSE